MGDKDQMIHNSQERAKRTANGLRNKLTGKSPNNKAFEILMADQQRSVENMWTKSNSLFDDSTLNMSIYSRVPLKSNKHKPNAENNGHHRKK